MEKTNKIRDYFNQKEMPKSMYYTAYADNALFDEEHNFLNKVREEKEYQDRFDYYVMQYRHMQLKEEYEGVERTSRELRMNEQIKFMQASLPVFAHSLTHQEYYKAMKVMEEEYSSVEEQLQTFKSALSKVLFLATRKGLNEVQETALFATLANLDVDTTKESVDEIALYDLKNEKKYVGIKEEKPKADCPTKEMLEKQLPERMVESITTTIKQMSKIAITKRKDNDFTLEFNNQDMIQLADGYVSKILADYEERPERYVSTCHSTMDVLNTYFDVKGSSRAKYRALTQDLEKFAEVQELEQEKE